MEKKLFVESKLEIVEIVAEDIISTSPPRDEEPGGNTELPDLPI